MFDWMPIVCWLTSCSRIQYVMFHSNGDVTIAGEGPMAGALGLCAGRDLCSDRGPRCLRPHQKDPPLPPRLSHLVGQATIQSWVLRGTLYNEFIVSIWLRLEPCSRPVRISFNGHRNSSHKLSGKRFIEWFFRYQFSSKNKHICKKHSLFITECTGDE